MVGAGAVGCYFGGMLARAGMGVTLIGRATHVDAISRDGLFLEGIRVRERIRVAASTNLEAVRDAGTVLFCLKTVDTENVAPAYLSSGNKNQPREDEIEASVPTDEFIANAPQAKDEYVVIPRVHIEQ